ncbi:restriction endonuclease subunit S [Escherichia albertii]|uniref:restriction endonuclease subunit S n=1 Tax=Escherichia albertii TaxID=208962 RepID=UPI0010BCAE28|nr:restriction endonuclease subunit S [Escherichia albertii]MCZ8595502.1 restriction endonuclease subunit S [Escherichia albertii]MCZ8664613.1 restriction endonuclease subunit S [Escherichia albertii]HEB0987709.1 restriction endonuclease subunit S [Escherichia albertii]HEB0992219.1 restriction endonuclease subunit S [Escherichia albertii]HEB0996782.1 restriction endonuclease subunit S [Escherichia albertii]
MGSKLPKLKLSEFACNASRRFIFNNKEKVVFINTSDVLSGKFLHKNLISSKGLPGQAKKAIKKGDILFSEIRPNNNRFALVDFDDCNNFVVSTKFMVLEINQEIMDLEFFYLQLTNPQTLADFQHIAESRSGTFPQITFDAISHYPFFCPNKIYQSQIKKVLLSITNKIEICQKNNITLEQMSQTLFKSWFVDFDPVIDNALDAGNPIPEALQSRAELRQKVRNSTDFKPLPAEIRSLFPSEFEETELGWVPKTWTISNLGKEFNITMGQSPSGSTYNEDRVGLPFFQGKTDFGFRFPSERIYCTDPKRVANKLDTLLSVRAPVGVTNLASTECIIGRGLAALRHKSGNIAFTYYSVSNLSDYFSVFNGEGTVFGSINQKDLKQLPLICPPTELINKFEELSGKWEEKIFLHCGEIENLSKLRDTLLPKLISGELSLEDLPDLTTDTEAA